MQWPPPLPTGAAAGRLRQLSHGSDGTAAGARSHRVTVSPAAPGGPDAAGRWRAALRPAADLSQH
jgi:hypothetical protein